MNIIEFKDFTFKYNNQSEATLKNINISIKAGEKVLIAGSSGSGKSTLGACINGLQAFANRGSYSGKLLVEGIDPFQDSIFLLNKKVGTILQDQDSQFVGLTVEEDVAFVDENNCVEPSIMRKGVYESLGLVNMEKKGKNTPQELSGGQKQRVSLAGILHSEAPILLLDEPLANLDPLSGKKTIELLKKINQESNKTIIVVEHRIEEVLEGDFTRVILIDNGVVVGDSTPNEILKSNKIKEYGLREPLYVEALKYAGVNIAESDLYPLERALTDSTKEMLKRWVNNRNMPSNELGEVILKVKNLSFSYDEEGENTIEDISLQLRSGEILAILGNNGAGKSTLSKVISGINRHKIGDIFIDNMLINEFSIKKRTEKIGYVMQNPNHMITQDTLIKEVKYGLTLRGIENATKLAEDALRICGLYKYRNWPATSLSYGQKKRLTIASIIALKPKVLILDEPTAGQDYSHYVEFMTFVKDLRKLGIGIILITHDMHLVLEYCDKAIVLSEGKILADSIPSVVFTDEKTMEKANLRETSLSKLAKLVGISSEELIETFINTEFSDTSRIRGDE